MEFNSMAKSPKSAIIDQCIRLANDLADEHGFVPIRSIAGYFSISVIFRPLLVEAMLASLPGPEGKKPTWIVLADSERFSTTQESYESESVGSPLPGRLRNTLAHEITHSLSFRSSDSDFIIRTEKRPQESRQKYINRIERETEELSPLLLIPEKCLNSLAYGSRADLGDILRLQRRCAVSREVLITRLSLWKKHDPTGGCAGRGLENLGLGVGFWKGGNAYLSSFPLFVNFRNARDPAVFNTLRYGNAIKVSELFPDENFLLNRGTSLVSETDGHRPEEPLDYLKMKIRITVEPNAERRTGKFLFLVEKLDEEGTQLRRPALQLA